MLALRASLQSESPTSPVDLLGYAIHYARFDSFRFLFEEIFLHEDYFFETDAPAPFILDAGSNIGMSTLYFKKLYPDARIIGFEAMPSTFEILRKNVEENRLRDVTVYNRALAATPGTTSFRSDPSEAGSLLASAATPDTDGTCHVENALLSDYIDGPVDLLKLDVEGAEDAVLQELVASGKLSSIRKIIFEYHHHLLEYHQRTPSGRDTLSETLSLLERAGFGYLISGSFEQPPRPGSSQNFLIFAYAKKELPHLAPESSE